MERITIRPRKGFTQKQREAILAHCGGLCGACGKPIEGPFEIDHQIPHALGGSHDIDNFAAMHPGCHAEKTKTDVAIIAKAKRIEKAHFGLVTRRKHIVPGSKASGWKKPLHGPAHRRPVKES